jgi:hypothetical protein
MDVGVALCRDGVDERGAILVGADDHCAPVEPALLGPAPDHHEQRTAEGQKRNCAGHIERADPDARELIARFSEKRKGDNDEKHHRPGGHQSQVGILVTAERLHVIDVCDLERECRQGRNGDDGRGITPFKAIERNHIRTIDGEPDRHQKREFDQANGAGQHDRRVGSGNGLRRRHLCDWQQGAR